MTITKIEEVLSLGKVIPVVTIHNMDDAKHVADALYEGGIKVIEITLRTRCALDGIKSLNDHPIIVGAGTVTTTDRLKYAQDAGAEFFVSPGFTAKLAEAGKDLPYLPGVETISEIMRAMGHGYTNLKFYPAELSGGSKAVLNFKNLFPQAKFCPTGGIGDEKMRHYIKLSNVPCVGGSWLASEDDIENQRWNKIKGAAKLVQMMR